MKINLPKHGKDAIALSHFPTRHQAFIFRAYEYIPPVLIAKILKTTEENVLKAASDMGLKKACESNIWLNKGYITIIRRMWHVLPYEQLLELLGMEEEELAVILREEDFLDIKLSDKPVCDKVFFRELTKEEECRTQEIKKIVETIDMTGAEPFSFTYDVTDMQFSGKQNFNLRMMYCFSGLYQHAFDVDSRIYCPDEMLAAYQKVGINALWTQGVLYQLTEFPYNKELSVGYQDRISRLRDFTERCEKYGIKVFLYLNEPRSMPENFYEKYPKIKGHNAKDDKVCMCTSTKEVQEYLTGSVEAVCREVPKIGGFFLVTRSENPTNCYSHSTRETCTCERCSKRKESEVIAEVISCVEKGAHKVNSEIKVIAWDWAWNEYSIDIIKSLPENVILMCKSEQEIPFVIGGIRGAVRDYSMSNIGPGEKAKERWKAARERGLEIAAKVQVNTTWEGSTVPALPVYPLIEEHMKGILDEGVTNVMLSWTLGGYPSRNLMYVAKYFYEEYNHDAFYETEEQKKAACIFSEAFQEFPFDLDVLYQGPQNAGPSNLLFLEPTGYTATMTCFAYDDIESWRSIYPREIFESQLAKLCDKWQEGLDLLEKEAYGEMKVMANAAYCLYKSSLNQFRFYLARERGDKAGMIKEAREEITCAEKMLAMMNLNSAIGFEAANHYYFSKGSLCEKIVNCYDIIKKCNE